MKVLCGVCMAAIGRVESIVREGTEGSRASCLPYHGHHIGAEGTAKAQGAGKGKGERQGEGTGMQQDGTEAVNAIGEAGKGRRVIGHGVVFLMLSKVCISVAKGSLAGHIDTGAVKQTLSKILEGFMEVLLELRGWERSPSSSRVHRQGEVAGRMKSSQQSTTAAMAKLESETDVSDVSLAERAVEGVAACIDKLPAGLVDRGMCSELLGLVYGDSEEGDSGLDGLAEGYMVV